MAAVDASLVCFVVCLPSVPTFPFRGVTSPQPPWGVAVPTPKSKYLFFSLCCGWDVSTGRRLSHSGAPFWVLNQVPVIPGSRNGGGFISAKGPTAVSSVQGQQRSRASRGGAQGPERWGSVAAVPSPHWVFGGLLTLAPPTPPPNAFFKPGYAFPELPKSQRAPLLRTQTETVTTAK